MPSVYKTDTNTFEVVFGPKDYLDDSGAIIVPYSVELEQAICEMIKETYADKIKREPDPVPEWEYKSCHAGCIDSDCCSSSCQMRKYYRRRPGGEWEEY